MRFLTLLLALLCSITWVLLLDHPQGPLPALGPLLDPEKGFWANAEPVQPAAGSFTITPLKTVRVEMDSRLVPHIKAANDVDLYRAQGYLHACYRLWQMDMQTRAAAGRISEVAGEKTFAFDRLQRRKGMLWAAENSLKAMEANPVTKRMLDAYTSGVNLYISTLTFKDYPLEYKLMGFSPEPWTNLKCALLLKYMADDLTGNVDDIAMSYLRSNLRPEELDDLYPEMIGDSKPVIPAGTAFAPASMPVPPAPRGELFASFDTSRKNAATDGVFREGSGIGSNNWAVGAALTGDGSAILCNDPHLGLNLPSIWYELQLTAPGINSYGVSIPGAPGIIIGFNDSISWGFTNNYRDVKDYYEIKTSDSRLYTFDGRDVPFNERYETIRIKGRKEPFTDTVRFTIHGPVLYDGHFPEPSGSGKTLAVTWMAHRATNELMSVYLYNRARNYDEFVQAIRHFECPAQNFIFADRKGNIALWGQGRFINKWKDQGRYVMRGDISATLWGDTIPMQENPHVLNPPAGYLASANQQVTDRSYPYWYNGDFTEFRSWEINLLLARDTAMMRSQDRLRYMGTLQNSNWSYLAWKLLPALPEMEPLRQWDARDEKDSRAASFFQIFWHQLYKNIWQDEFRNYPEKLYPSAERTLALLLQDTASRYFDDLATPGREGRAAIIQLSYRQATDSLQRLGQQGGAEWYKVKNTSVMHLAKLPAFSYERLATGGWGNTINAMKQNHGPSWRMIVEMSPAGITAYGVYPGGQSGNPGSAYYGTFIDSWVKGSYYRINFR